MVAETGVAPRPMCFQYTCYWPRSARTGPWPLRAPGQAVPSPVPRGTGSGLLCPAPSCSGQLLPDLAPSARYPYDGLFSLRIPELRKTHVQAIFQLITKENLHSHLCNSVRLEQNNARVESQRGRAGRCVPTQTNLPGAGSSGEDQPRSEFGIQGGRLRAFSKCSALRRHFPGSMF